MALLSLKNVSLRFGGDPLLDDVELHIERGDRICLLGDQHGIYLTVNSQFIDCASDRPLWPRTSLSKALLRDIQKRVAQYL